ncbi:phosphatase 2C-like domain-containing protein [Fusarium acuminatum]|uniref:protein-serine/threonine phosphatase n=1 Tax=Fusarium acuminatum TaxID=5515 RepID=A0ABZ2WSU8_9HYPO
MGQTLSEPVVEKTSDTGEDERLIYGVSAMQGWRISMEDAHTTVLDLDSAKSHSSKLSFFGVFDGHGGDKVALFTGQNIHNIIFKQETFKSGDYAQGLKDGFLATDRAILNDPKYEEEVSGCTACVGLIAGNKLYVVSSPATLISHAASLFRKHYRGRRTANAGDSRGVLGIKGRAKPLSQDHKPQLENEKNRITAAGGFVDFGRVNGNLALSRAIGDFEFKKSAELSPENQIVTAYPDVEQHDLTDEDEFLVLACDGIWDCQSSQAVVEFVRRGIAAKQELDKICENMMDNCLASNSETGGVGCDNMTMLIIGFLNGKSKDEWYEEIARRVANGDGPCAPPEYAEFRGPGVHHNFEDSDSGYEMDPENKGRSFGVGGYRGRIIFLGDGTEVLTDSDDTEMFDNADEDKDLASQVSKNPTSAEKGTTPVAAPASENASADTKPADATVTKTADKDAAEEVKKEEIKKE